MVLWHPDDGNSFPREMLSTLYGHLSFQPAQHCTRSGTWKPVVTKLEPTSVWVTLQGNASPGTVRGVKQRERHALVEGLRASKCPVFSYLILESPQNNMELSARDLVPNAFVTLPLINYFPRLSSLSQLCLTFLCVFSCTSPLLKCLDSKWDACSKITFQMDLIFLTFLIVHNLTLTMSDLWPDNAHSVKHLLCSITGLITTDTTEAVRQHNLIFHEVHLSPEFCQTVFLTST